MPLLNSLAICPRLYFNLSPCYAVIHSLSARCVPGAVFIAVNRQDPEPCPCGVSIPMRAYGQFFFKLKCLLH